MTFGKQNQARQTIWYRMKIILVFLMFRSDSENHFVKSFAGRHYAQWRTCPCEKLVSLHNFQRILTQKVRKI